MDELASHGGPSLNSKTLPGAAPFGFKGAVLDVFGHRMAQLGGLLSLTV
jgi:hypothetical protein